jgi:hypothetical protein
MKVCFFKEYDHILAVFPEVSEKVNWILTYCIKEGHSPASLEYIKGLEEVSYSEIDKKKKFFEYLKKHYVGMDIEIISKNNLFNQDVLCMECELLEDMAFEHFEIGDLEKAKAILVSYSCKIDLLQGLMNTSDELVDLLPNERKNDPRYHGSELEEEFCEFMNTVCLEHSQSFQR